MNKSQLNCNWTRTNFQAKEYQTEIFMGFNINELSYMTIMINSLIENLDLSLFDQYYKSNNVIGGRPNVDYKIMLKIYLYALYNSISVRKLNEYNALGSNLHYLMHGTNKLPGNSTFSDFLKVLDNHIDEIFNMTIEYTKTLLTLDTKNLYCDGTIFEAHNNRHKIITDNNLKRSNKKWSKILEDVASSEEERKLAVKKLDLNKERENKLKFLGRQSYGRTDEDSVILMDKNKSFIAGFNVQLVEEAKYGLIVFTHTSNKNPDSEVFKEMLPLLTDCYDDIETITFDSGYGTAEILELLNSENIKAIVTARKGKNSNTKINNYHFKVSEDNKYLTCPNERKLTLKSTNDKGNSIFKNDDCTDCVHKKECCPKQDFKTVRINADELRLINKADEIINSEDGKERFSKRGNLCESPNGFIIYNLKGKKLRMKGLVRNNTVIKLYAILYNLSRLNSIMSNSE